MPRDLEFNTEDPWYNSAVEGFAPNEGPDDLPGYDDPTGQGNPNFGKIEDVYRGSQYSDPRFQFLDKQLMGQWSQENEALQGILNQQSMSELAQNAQLSQASQLGVEGFSSGNAAGAANALSAQGQLGGDTVNAMGGARVTEDIGRLDMMNAQAGRRGDYQTAVQGMYSADLLNKLGMTDQYNNQMGAINDARQRLRDSFGGDAVAGAANTINSGAQAGLQGYNVYQQSLRNQNNNASDERLKKEIKEEGGGEGAIAVGLKALGDVSGKLRATTSAQRFNAEEGPQVRYMRPHTMGPWTRNAIGSGVELKEDIKETSSPSLETPAAEQASELPRSSPTPSPTGLRSDKGQAEASSIINSNPHLVRELQSGRLDMKDALYGAALTATTNKDFEGADRLRALARKTPRTRDNPSPYSFDKDGRTVDPFDFLEQRDMVLLEKTAEANMAGLSPVFNDDGELTGYAPGKGVTYSHENPRIADAETRRKVIRSSPTDTSVGGNPGDRPGDPVALARAGRSRIAELRQKYARGGGHSAMDDVAGIKKYSYKYNDKADKYLGKKVSGKKKTGVMAQQVAEKNPEMVGEHNGHMTVKEDQGLGKALASHGEVARKVQELSVTIDQLDAAFKERMRRTR